MPKLRNTLKQQQEKKYTRP